MGRIENPCVVEDPRCFATLEETVVGGFGDRVHPPRHFWVGVRHQVGLVYPPILPVRWGRRPPPLPLVLPLAFPLVAPAAALGSRCCSFSPARRRSLRRRRA